MDRAGDTDPTIGGAREDRGADMKAVYIDRFGGPEVVKYGDLPDPVAGRGDIVVEIVNASVNAADWKVRNGQYKQATFPLGIGRDFSGVVSAVGEGVDDLARAPAGGCRCRRHGSARCWPTVFCAGSTPAPDAPGS